MYINGDNTELFTVEKMKSFMCLSPYFFLQTDSIKNISLIESAAAFSSKPSPKCLLEKIDVITGEEAEHNVLKVCISHMVCIPHISLPGSTYIHETSFYQQEHL